LGDTDSTSTSSASKQQEHIQHSTPQHVATVGNGDVLNLLPDWPQSASDAAVLQGLIDLLLPEYGARWGWLHTLHFMWCFVSARVHLMQQCCKAWFTYCCQNMGPGGVGCTRCISCDVLCLPECGIGHN
jgi:hypothetical protein